MKTTNIQDGFTAIELLISLLIAAMFLFSGYQLYVHVTRSGSDSDKTARLSNIVYDKLRTSVASTTAAYPGGCTSSFAPTQSTVQEPGIGSVIYTTKISCPYPSGTAGAPVKIFLIRIDASVDGGATQKVSHATFTS
jgi:prepilin-type N-terminal cleavage/methylation domain-containing protein